MSVGERHTLNGYGFTETLHGPNGADRCVDCGVATYSVRAPEGRDIGPSRCSKCGRVYFGVPDPVPPVPAVPRSGDLAARRAWQDTQDAAGVRPPLPAPVRTSRELWPDDVPVPRGAAILADHATANGWQVRITYACGNWAGARGSSLRRNVLLRCWRPEASALAWWLSPDVPVKWTFDGTLVLDAYGLNPRLNVTALRTYLWLAGSGGVLAYPEEINSAPARSDGARGTLQPSGGGDSDGCLP
jgi:hypothetical protein